MLYKRTKKIMQKREKSRNENEVLSLIKFIKELQQYLYK